MDTSLDHHQCSAEVVVLGLTVMTHKHEDT